MKVINFFASPGSGKTIIAASIFVELKKIFSAVEINLEYAKKLLYEERFSILQDNQLYIFAKQEKIFHDLKNKGMEYVVTDSPLLLSSIYNNPDNLNQEIFESLILDIHNRYENINFFIERNLNYGHDPNGRLHNLEQAIEIDQRIKNMLNRLSIPFHVIQNNKNTNDKVLEIVLKERMNCDKSSNVK